MKNTILALLGVALLVCIFACNPIDESFELTSSQQPLESSYPIISTESFPNSEEIGLVDGRIVFYTETAFENLSENLQNPDYIDNFKLLVQSKGDYQPDTEYKNYTTSSSDDHLKGFLWNSDQLLQVGNWYFKLDAEDMRLNYLHTDHSTQLSDLIRGSRGGDIISIEVADGMGSEDDFRSYPTSCYLCLIGTVIGNPNRLPDVIGTSISCFLCRLELDREEKEERDRDEE